MIDEKKCFNKNYYIFCCLNRKFRSYCRLFSSFWVSLENSLLCVWINKPQSKNCARNNALWKVDTKFQIWYNEVKWKKVVSLCLRWVNSFLDISSLHHMHPKHWRLWRPTDSGWWCELQCWQQSSSSQARRMHHIHEQHRKIRAIWSIAF